MATDWEMPKRGELCAACDKSFEPGDEIRAYLFESPEGYERRDYCLNCKPPDEPFAIGSWQTRRPLPAIKKNQVFDRAAMLNFFERLVDADTPAKQQLRFVLGLLLWRKKIVKFDHSGAAEDGRELWHFTVSRTGAEYIVVRPALDEEQLERLGMQLEELMSGEVNDLSAMVADSDENAEEPATEIDTDDTDAEDDADKIKADETRGENQPSETSGDDAPVLNANEGHTDD